MVHGIGRQVEFAGPGDKVAVDIQLVKRLRVSQFGKHALVGAGRETHRSFKSIGKLHPKTPGLQNPGFHDIPIHGGLL